MAAQQEALQGEVLSELLITDNDEVKAQYPDDIDDTGIRKGAIIHYGSRRGVVAHDPQDESVAVRFPGHEEAEVLPLHEVLLARPARKEARSWKRRPRTCTMLFASPNLTRIMATRTKLRCNKSATATRRRSGP